jgi:hypothetical protein
MRLFLNQGKYTMEILKEVQYDRIKIHIYTDGDRFDERINDDDSDEIDPHVYRQLIGSLMYLVNTRPNICYATNVLSQSMSQLRQTHWIAIKHVLRYIRGTIGYGLRYASSVNLSLQEYADTD